MKSPEHVHVERTASGAQDLADRLFAPASLEDFVAARWGRLPFYVHGSPDKFSSLYSLTSFQSQLAGDLTPAKGRRAAPLLKAVHNRDGGGAIFHFPANLAMGLFDAGMTLCASGVEVNDERLTALVSAVRRRLHFTGRIEINSYYSPEGEGFGWHYDSQHVFILQLDGSKDWRLSAAPGVDSPPFTMSLAYLSDPRNRQSAATLGMKVKVPAEMDIIEQTLAPGDMLYLPPGVWHAAAAHSYSFALTLTLYPISFARVLQGVLAALTMSRSEWRRDVHEGRCNPLTGAADTQASRLDELLTELRGRLDGMTSADIMGLFNEIRQVPLMARMTDHPD